MPSGFLSSDDCRALIRKLATFAHGGGTVSVTLKSAMRNTTSWARSTIHENLQSRITHYQLWRAMPELGMGTVDGTRLDDAGLREVMRNAEMQIRLSYRTASEPTDDAVIPPAPMLHPVIWSDATYAVSPDAIVQIAQEMVTPAAAAGLWSAGTFSVTGRGESVQTIDVDAMTPPELHYVPQTEVECSVTVRDKQGTASGWAGVNHYALDKINPHDIAARALDKCRRSANPSTIEPGRYTVILEPQATHDLVWQLMTSREALWRPPAESGQGPFASSRRGRSKIGERVLDERLTLSSDPLDPDGGFIPISMAWGGIPYRAVTWIERGYLRQLAYDKQYALGALNRDHALLNPMSYRLAAAPGVATQTIDEMIATTARGIVVTRFSDVQVVDGNSMLCEGFTRDGLWLVEHGKVTKSLRNFRFMESPIFVLNNVQGVGVSQRVFEPGYGCVAPAIRAIDFNFVGLADAV